MAINLLLRRVNTHRTEISHAIEIMRHFMQETRLQERSRALAHCNEFCRFKHRVGTILTEESLAHSDAAALAPVAKCHSPAAPLVLRRLTTAKEDSNDEATCAWRSGRRRGSVSTSLHAPLPLSPSWGPCGQAAGPCSTRHLHLSASR